VLFSRTIASASGGVMVPVAILWVRRRMISPAARDISKNAAA
jgi:hypothetical protein